MIKLQKQIRMVKYSLQQALRFIFLLKHCQTLKKEYNTQLKKILFLSWMNSLLKILIDDREGLGVARVLGLCPIRTTAVLLMFYRNGIIDYRGFCDDLLRLSEEGYSITASVYAKLLR